MTHSPHPHPAKRISALKIALLSLLPLLNQVLPSLWLLSSDSFTPPLFGFQFHLEEPFGASSKARVLRRAEPTRKPRVFYLEENYPALVFQVHPNLQLELEERQVPEYPVPKPHLCYGYAKQDCAVPSGGAWQHSKSGTYTCNNLHELDLPTYLTPQREQAKLVGQGGKRLVWKVQDNATSPVALKMFKYRKEKVLDFGPLSLDYQRRDAVIHQVTSASRYTIDIYGFCGASALYEFADGGELQGNIDNKGPLKGETLLRTAYTLTAGLSHLHLAHSNKDKPPAIAHADIYGNQWVKVQGTYKLTDFNLAKFMVRNRTTHENLPFRRDVVDNWFAPEVHRQGETKKNIVNEKMDLWGMGNVLYLIVTGNKPFRGVHRTKIHKMIMERTLLRPPLPDVIRNSDDYALRAVTQAIDMCMVELPEERPTAYQLAKFLKQALTHVENYDSLKELNNRHKRFPSVQERVKRYMGNWYTLPCSGELDAYIRYQLLPKPNATAPNSVLIQALSEFDHIVKIDAQLQTDNAMMLEPHMLELNNTKLPHNGFRTDIQQTVIPFWRALQEKPLITQWGDKTTLVVSDLIRVNESHAPLNIPHLKKCRRVLTQEQIDRMSGADACRSASGDVAPPDLKPSDYDPDQLMPALQHDNIMPPIIWKVDSNRLLGNIPMVRTNDIPWEKKLNKAVFRGRLTGNALNPDRSVIYRYKVSEEEYCDALDRCRLVRRMHNSSLVDAKVMDMRNKPINSTIGGVRIVGNRMSMKDYLKHKALIVLEGNDVPSGLGWSMRSNSVVLMPPPTWSSWLMEELLEPWVHFVPLNPNLNDVEEKMQWVLDHDAEAKRIAHRASLWVKDLLEHPDAQRDNDEIFKRMLFRYQKQFVFSEDLLDIYEAQQLLPPAPTRKPKPEYKILKRDMANAPIERL